MLVMLSFPDSQPKHSSGLRPGGRETIEHPKPPQVGVEVLGGDALEAAHPPAQAADDIGIDVLHMPGAAHAYAAADVDGLVLDAQGMRGPCQGDAAIGAQDRIGRQYGVSAACTLAALLESRMTLAVAPARSRAIKTGVYSQPLAPASALPPRRRALRSNPLWPLHEIRK